MGRVTVICVHADQTIEIRRKRTHANQMIWDKVYSPTFIDTFEEVRTWSLLKFWKGRKRFVLWLYGTPKCFRVEIPELNENRKKEIAEKLNKTVAELTDQELAEFVFPYWNLKEAEKIIAKVIAKSKADQRVIGGKEFYILLIMQIITLIMTLRALNIF